MHWNTPQRQYSESNPKFAHSICQYYDIQTAASTCCLYLTSQLSSCLHLHWNRGSCADSSCRTTLRCGMANWYFLSLEVGLKVSPATPIISIVREVLIRPGSGSLLNLIFNFPLPLFRALPVFCRPCSSAYPSSEFWSFDFFSIITMSSYGAFIKTPPPGGDQNRGDALLIVIGISLTLVVVTLLLRMYARLIIVRLTGWDDYTIIASTVRFWS